MYLIKTPQFIQNLFPNFTWRIPTEEKVLYLTFDDGPIPEVTPWVMEQLEKFRAKATFFCVGDNIRKYPNVFEQVLAAGHAVGNHTFNHLNGWATENIPYFHNVRHGASMVHSMLFRPPYGHLKPKQAQFLQRHYRIVMWDVLSGDFDPAISGEQCLHNVVDNAQRGSIIVFHDSIKAEEKLRYTLPLVLEHFAERGYRFEALNGNAQLQEVRQFA
jgi:peptidoglycan/xylan/chitin deacetylase (PgdA/CDA1 family)